LTRFDAWFLDINVLVALTMHCTRLKRLDVGVITGEITAQELSSVERLTICRTCGGAVRTA
jgi:hypothetical protein